MGVGNTPRYQNGPCFAPFPFPNATPTEVDKVREIGERLNKHRMDQLELHHNLKVVDIYSVLRKIRDKEPLTAIEIGNP